MDTEAYPVYAGLLIQQAVTWWIPYPEYGGNGYGIWQINFVDLIIMDVIDAVKLKKVR